MLKRKIKKITDYYQLIKDDRTKLIPFYICYSFNEIIKLIIPLCIANITQYLTNSLLKATIISVISYFLLKGIHSLLTYVDMHTYSHFFKNNYITLYKKVVNRIYHFDLKNKEKFTTGRILNTLTTDIVNIGEMADNLSAWILNTIKYMIIIFYFVKIKIALFFLILLFSFLYLLISNYLTTQAIKYQKKQIKENDKLLGLINQTIQGLQDIQTLDFSLSMNNQYQHIYDTWVKMYDNKRKYQIIRKSLLTWFSAFFKTLVYFITINLVFKQNITIGTMLVVISYFDSLSSSIENIMSSQEEIKKQIISVERISDLLKQKKSTTCHQLLIPPINGIIEFKNVSFSYHNENLLNQLNFCIKPNTITAITGPNGVGKTTLINLILRVYTPTKGKILLDHYDIEQLDKKSILEHISILNQDTYLFNLSIRQNFNLINKDKKRQEQLCKLVGLDHIIKNLPKGYDTIIKEQSSNLSGGQKRLLSFVRTLLKNTKILILDEVTSSLDIKTMKKTIEILKTLKHDHTIIIITHKKEMLNIADEKIIVEKGKIR